MVLIYFSGGIPNVVAAGKAVLKDWNRSVLNSFFPKVAKIKQRNKMLSNKLH